VAYKDQTQIQTEELSSVKGKDNVTADTLSRIFEDMTEEQKLDSGPQTEFQDDFILSSQDSLPTPRWDENVYSVNSPNRFCCAVFPEYSFDRNDDVNSDLASEV